MFPGQGGSKASSNATATTTSATTTDTTAATTTAAVATPSQQTIQSTNVHQVPEIVSAKLLRGQSCRQRCQC